MYAFVLPVSFFFSLHINSCVFIQQRARLRVSIFFFNALQFQIEKYMCHALRIKLWHYLCVCFSMCIQFMFVYMRKLCICVFIRMHHLFVWHFFFKQIGLLFHVKLQSLWWIKIDDFATLIMQMLLLLLLFNKFISSIHKHRHKLNGTTEKLLLVFALLNDFSEYMNSYLRQNKYIHRKCTYQKTDGKLKVTS